MVSNRIDDRDAAQYPLHVLREYALLADGERGSRWITETGVTECREALAFPGEAWRQPARATPGPGRHDS